MVYIDEKEVDEMLRLKFKCCCDDELKDKIESLQNQMDEIKDELKRRKDEKNLEYFKTITLLHDTIRDMIQKHPEYVGERRVEIKAYGNSYDFSWKDIEQSLFSHSLKKW